jgi:hypothetical protein
MQQGLSFEINETWAHNIGNVGGDATTAFAPETILWNGGSRPF